MDKVTGQLAEFKKFILRGNVVDLAVAVVIGGAFNAIVQAIVKDFITPLIGLIGGKQDFSSGVLHFRGQQFLFGDFINNVISFLAISLVVFFFVVQPVNKLIAISNRNKKPADPTTKKCPECLAEIPKDATRCQFCTSKLPSKEAKA